MKSIYIITCNDRFFDLSFTTFRNKREAIVYSKMALREFGFKTRVWKMKLTDTPELVYEAR